MEEILRAVHRLVRSHCHETDLRAREMALQVKALVIKAFDIKGL